MLFYLFFILIIFWVFCFPITENFNNANYQFLDGMDFQDRRFVANDQNVGKNWINQPQAYNYPTVQTYGTSYLDLYKLNQYIFNDFRKKEIDNFLKQYSQEFKFDTKDYLKTYTPFDIVNINKDTWFNKFNWNPNMVLYEKYTESVFDEVNICNLNFLNLFNRFWFAFIGKYDKKKVNLYKPYFILKYRIIEIWESKEKMTYQNQEYAKYRIFQIVTVITRDNGYLAFQFKLSGLFEFDGKKCNLQKLMLKYVSEYTLDQVLLRGNLNKDNLYYNVNPLYKNDESISSMQAEKIYKQEKKRVDDEKDNLDDYACFTFDEKSNNPYSEPMYSLDKNDCQNRFNPIGYPKPFGVWDKPCVRNEDCMFYQANENYKNDYGRCINGKCQLPVNMKNLGYHYYIKHKSTKPLCYNCESKEWLPNTKLDFCCDKQKDRKKYPFLKSPDYAFAGDSVFRLNNYLQKKCKMKPLYSNIFEKPKTFKIDCDGYLDTYYLKKQKNVL